MAAPLEDIRVVEVANWLAAPAAAALLRDLGADVIKVEPPGGDVFRGFPLRSLGYEHDFDLNYAFEVDNRGKRSISIALDRPGGPELVHRLCARADVFVTNLTPPRRERYALGEERLLELNPRLVYASLSGYGTRGPDAERPGFDYAAFWARSGLMSVLGEPPSPPPLCRGGQGDHTAALNLLAAVLAALRLRDRSGEGQYVEVTLQGTGMWTLAADLSVALAVREQPARHDRQAPANPIWNSYRTRDGRWLLLVMPQPDPYWPGFCRALEWEAWIDDARYASAAGRSERTRELTASIQERFETRTLAEWGGRLDAERVIWAPVAELPDVVADVQPRETGAITRVTHPEHGSFETLDTPFELRGSDVSARGPAPGPGQHTRQILEELGVTPGEVADLQASGALPRALPESG